MYDKGSVFVSESTEAAEGGAAVSGLRSEGTEYAWSFGVEVLYEFLSLLVYGRSLAVCSFCVDEEEVSAVASSG